MSVFEAFQSYYFSEMEAGNSLLAFGHVETLEDFQRRALAFKQKVRDYAKVSVASDEHVLIVTHSRMINCFFDAMTWNEAKKKYDWGLHTEVSDLFKREI
mmetsp:Transcript_28686/g.33708  ORF Transcript_28686/g.33708 Transcript_28686/m.33708 type:complete len:100 (-) Transcript_28686:48-347(-)